MDSSSQHTIVYDTLYYVKYTALSIKTISRPLPIIVLQIAISSLVRYAIFNLSI